MAGHDYLNEIKGMSSKELNGLCISLREKIIKAVSKNGGHLASNLGMVEATVALHTVFNSPSDKIIFDVGHQSYAHKILTGREESLDDSLRTFGGISGFPRREESVHDFLSEGHSGTSVSSALGVAEANRLQGKDDYAVAVIGDGSLTNGLVYEALNNCAKKDLRLIILVNDNEMSISKNVGGLPNYLSKIRVSRGYFRFKWITKRLAVLPLLGKPFVKLSAWIKNITRRVFLRSTMFEDLGLDYIGPVDGNNISKLITALEEAKRRACPVVVHIRTKKGFGYAPAENEPSKYHGICGFDPEKGIENGKKECFSAVAGKHLTALADKDEKICAITAAMAEGTGLDIFEEAHKDRFFDVGIAEEHAITFGASLSASGMKPVISIYSTFAQRVFDQAFHDVSIQKLPLTLLLDRCGLVEGDGITHQGIFDYPLFSSVPNAKIYSPENYSELKCLIEKSVDSDSFDIIRYPKGSEKSYTPAKEMVYNEKKMLYYSSNIKEAKRVIVTYGRITSLANEVIAELGDIALVKLVRIFPLDMEYLSSLLSGKELVYILEEGYIHGGFGEKLSACLNNVGKTHIHAIDTLVEHGSLDDLFNFCGFTTEQILENIEKI